MFPSIVNSFLYKKSCAKFEEYKFEIPGATAVTFLGYKITQGLRKPLGLIVGFSSYLWLRSVKKESNKNAEHLYLLQKENAHLGLKNDLLIKAKNDLEKKDIQQIGMLWFALKGKQKQAELAESENGLLRRNNKFFREETDLSKKQVGKLSSVVKNNEKTITQLTLDKNNLLVTKQQSDAQIKKISSLAEERQITINSLTSQNSDLSTAKQQTEQALKGMENLVLDKTIENNQLKHVIEVQISNSNFQQSQLESLQKELKEVSRPVKQETIQKTPSLWERLNFLNSYRK